MNTFGKANQYDAPAFFLDVILLSLNDKIFIPNSHTRDTLLPTYMNLFFLKRSCLEVKITFYFLYSNRCFFNSILSVHRWCFQAENCQNMDINQ